MVGVEDLRGLGDLQVFLSGLVPRQLGDMLEKGPDDLGLHRLAADPAQPAELAIDFLACLLGQIEPFEAQLELIDLGAIVFVAELAPNGLQLFAEIDLALPVAELFLHLRLDVLLGIEHGNLPLHVHEDAAEPLVDGERLEQALAAGSVEIEIAGDEVGEAPRLVDAVEHLLHHFVGESGLLAQLGGAGAQFAMQGNEARIRIIHRREVVHVAHHGDEMAVLLDHLQCHRAALAVQEQLHPRHAALQLADLGDGADQVEPVRGDGFDVFLLGHREDELVGRGEGSFDRLEGHGTACPDRSRDAREEHHVAQGEDGKGQTFSHEVLLETQRLDGDRRGAVHRSTARWGGKGHPPCQPCSQDTCRGGR